MEELLRLWDELEEAVREAEAAGVSAESLAELYEEWAGIGKEISELLAAQAELIRAQQAWEEASAWAEISEAAARARDPEIAALALEAAQAGDWEAARALMEQAGEMEEEEIADEWGEVEEEIERWEKVEEEQWDEIEEYWDEVAAQQEEIEEFLDYLRELGVDVEGLSEEDLEFLTLHYGGGPSPDAERRAVFFTLEEALNYVYSFPSHIIDFVFVRHSPEGWEVWVVYY